jgi:type IX secretion system PorP/SprF family membrane protein
MNMFSKYTLVLIGLTFMGSAGLQAQQEQMYTHYDFNSMALNPAYAGSKRTLVATGLSRVQWANYPGAPRYQNFGIHSPLVGDFAVGLNVQSGTIGKFEVASPVSETHIGANLAYHKQLDKDLRLAVGLRLGAYNYKFQLSQLRLNNPTDVAFQNNDYSITAPMTGFGIYLYSSKAFAAFSAPRMVFIPQDVRQNQNVAYAAELHYYLSGGMVFDMNDRVKLKPTTQIKIVNGVPVQADLNLHAIFDDVFSLGAFYRTQADIGLMSMVQLNDQFNFVYSYDSKLSPLNEYVRGSHEFGLQFMIPYTSNHRVPVPRYF